MTDDRGVLRAFPLEPGQYIVCAEPGDSTTFGTSSSSGRRERFVRTCHPSAAEADAAPVSLQSQGAGEVDVRLRRSRTFSVSGAVLDASGAPASAVTASLVRYTRNGVSAGIIPNTADGRFQVNNIEPGEYAIEATVGGPDRPEQGRALELAHVAVRVDASDIQDLVVSMTRAFDVAGHVTLEDAAASFRPDGGGLMIFARIPEGATFSTGSQAPAYMADNREFLLKRMYGRRLLDFVNVPRGWYVKAVRYRDREVTDVATEFRASADPSALEIVLSTRGASISGRVLDEVGNPVSGVTVVVFPVNPGRWNGYRPTVVPVSKEGAYQIGPLRGGEYFVVALDPAAVPPQPSSRGELAPLAEAADRITLSSEGQHALDLRVVKR
jgi:protocatechuate 3,4-dioxygenase beta subunit